MANDDGAAGNDAGGGLTDEQIRDAGGLTQADFNRWKAGMDSQIAELRSQAGAAGQQANEASRRAEEAEIKALEDPDEQATARAEAARQRADREIMARDRTIAQLKQQLEGTAAVVVARQIAEKYDVPISDLEGIPTPDAMETVAKRISEARKTAGEAKPDGESNEESLEEESQTPEFDTGGGEGAQPPYKAADFEHTGDVAGSLRAKRRAGYWERQRE